jgi:hypothetical protein
MEGGGILTWAHGRGFSLLSRRCLWQGGRASEVLGCVCGPKYGGDVVIELVGEELRLWCKIGWHLPHMHLHWGK